MDDDLKEQDIDGEEEEMEEDALIIGEVGKKKKDAIPHHDEETVGDPDGTESLDDLADDEEETLPEESFDDHDDL